MFVVAYSSRRTPEPKSPVLKLPWNKPWPFHSEPLPVHATSSYLLSLSFSGKHVMHQIGFWISADQIHSSILFDRYTTSAVRVTLCPSTAPWRRIEEAELKPHASLTSALDGSEWSSVPIEKEFVWSPELVWTGVVEKKIRTSARNRTSVALLTVLTEGNWKIEKCRRYLGTINVNVGPVSPRHLASTGCGWRRWSPGMEGSCEYLYIKWTIADSRQEMIL
jgi:hypothetical protein